MRFYHCRPYPVLGGYAGETARNDRGKEGLPARSIRPGEQIPWIYRRRSGLYLDGLSRERMAERQPAAPERGVAVIVAAAVFAVAQQRHFSCGKLCPNLMCASGIQLNAHQRCRAVRQLYGLQQPVCELRLPNALAQSLNNEGFVVGGIPEKQIPSGSGVPCTTARYSFSIARCRISSDSLSAALRVLANTIAPPVLRSSRCTGSSAIPSCCANALPISFSPEPAGSDSIPTGFSAATSWESSYRICKTDAPLYHQYQWNMHFFARNKRSESRCTEKSKPAGLSAVGSDRQICLKTRFIPRRDRYGLFQIPL